LWRLDCDRIATLVTQLPLVTYFAVVYAVSVAALVDVGLLDWRLTGLRIQPP
jgi:hypothetical protein